ncbi:hypothetical protein EV182_000150 [Spiromyces aspiralis]|uniref:Uncharacterized protein n=1 Tax=Spiromyces aspiralis TaxID=68401 RepID=A0ACC1HUX2_9FUNG|nr:hypothetical protein EV182_000150 [Spiromyces aspiralis]
MPPITSSIHGPGPAGLSRYILPGIQQPFGGVMSRRGSHPASMYVANSGHSGSALAAAIAAARQAAAGPAGYSMTDQSARPTLRPAATDIRDHGNQDRFGPENEDTADVQPRRFEARMEFELNLNLNAMWSILWLLIRMALFVAIFAQDASWERLALLAALAIGFFLLRTRRVPGLLRGVGADNGRAARRQQPIPGATLGNNPNNNNNDNNEPQPPLTIWHKVRTFFVALISTLVPGEPFTVPVNENE